MSGGLERIWNEPAGWPALARGALFPAALAYGAAIHLRNALYDRRVLTVAPSPVPAISIGNIAVGGTGKTPVSAWVASTLSQRGARPAIVMRGYGADEPLVHAVLNPGVRVFVDADRVRVVRLAAASGHDVVVMDDAFQHRRADRLIDLVLLSADRWSEPVRLLPAGPWREPLSAVRRSTMLLVTRRAVSNQTARALLSRFSGDARTGKGAVVELAAGPIVDFVSGATRPLDALRGQSVLVASGIGDPASLAGQLASVGAKVTRKVFPDHHVYDPSDVDVLISEGGRFDALVCTLKDAVKLGPLWPRGARPLWYVSQRVELEDGGSDVMELLDRLLAARH